MNTEDTKNNNPSDFDAVISFTEHGVGGENIQICLKFTDKETKYRRIFKEPNQEEIEYEKTKQRALDWLAGDY